MPMLPDEEVMPDTEIDSFISKIEGYRHLFKVAPCMKFDAWLKVRWPSRAAFREANQINKRTMEAWCNRNYYVYGDILLKPAKRFVVPDTPVDLLVTCHPIIELQEFKGND